MFDGKGPSLKKKGGGEIIYKLPAVTLRRKAVASERILDVHGLRGGRNVGGRGGNVL